MIWKQKGDCGRSPIGDTQKKKTSNVEVGLKKMIEGYEKIKESKKTKSKNLKLTIMKGVYK